MCSVKTAVLLSSLAALVTAQDEMVKLNPDDVAFGCATICGPVVELTDICHVGSHAEFKRKMKRRKLDKRQASVTNAFGIVVPAPVKTPASERVITITTVVTLTATPSQALPGGAVTTPAAGNPAPASSSVWTTTMTMVLPEDDAAGDGADAGDETGVRLAFPTTTSTPLTVGNAADGMETVDGVEDVEWAEQKETVVVEDAERSCVCNNTSFDVALVSGLCTSCIQQAGYSPGSMGEIMNQCQFAEQVYTETSDDIVDNVQVKAAAPTFSAGIDSSLISYSPPSPLHGTGFAGALAAGVACGLALLL